MTGAAAGIGATAGTGAWAGAGGGAVTESDGDRRAEMAAPPPSTPTSGALLSPRYQRDRFTGYAGYAGSWYTMRRDRFSPPKITRSAQQRFTGLFRGAA
jgi:hypothetical protein